MKPLLPPTFSITPKQRGAVLMVMLVIMIMGVSFFLVSALSKATLQNARNVKSSEMLAQAKEVVIGYAVSGGTRPGDLPFQDRLITPIEEAGTTDGHPNYNGLQDGCPGSDFCLGRLPWRTLGMSIESPSENDPSGFMPWYAVSGNLIDSTITINSELLNTDNVLHAPNNYPAPPHPWLTVRDMNGNVLSDRVAFVIIIPGPALPGQSRPAASIAPPVSLGGADQYLDSIGLPAGCNPNPPAPTCTKIYTNYGANNEFISGDEHRWIDDPANPGKQIEDPYYNFNDKLLYVTIDDLMPLIEKRIAREAKACLDDYAAQTNNNAKYPWAVPVSDTSSYLSANNIRFGRLPVSPNLFNNNPNVSAMTDALAQLQTALNNYVANNSATTRTALSNKGNLLENLGEAPQAPITTSIGNIAKNTGDAAKDLAKTPPQDTVSNVQTGIDNTMSAMATAGFIANDTTMSLAWPSSCALFSSIYWNDWRDLVFYQIANGNQPGASPSCSGTNCLSITSTSPLAGNGNFRATVVVSGKMRPGQARATTTDKQTLSNYLESPNSTGKANPPTSTSFESYKTSDSNYQNVTNDLVLCLDGKNNCQ